MYTGVLGLCVNMEAVPASAVSEDRRLRQGGGRDSGKGSLMSIPLSPNQAAGRRPQWFLRLCKGYRAGGHGTLEKPKRATAVLLHDRPSESLSSQDHPRAKATSHRWARVSQDQTDHKQNLCVPHLYPTASSPRE